MKTGEKKKNVILKRILLFALVALLPFAALTVIGESVKNNYHNSFNASLVDKYRLLCETEEPKIVFVGGSSLPFGLRCDLVEKELGYAAVDFGVYASLGTRVMTDLSLKGIKKGDIVVLAPELNAQTYSCYFNAEVLWESLCEDRSMIRALPCSDRAEMYSRYFGFLLGKIRISRSDGIGEDELYSRTSFNRYGDIEYPRPANIMPEGYDKSQPITISDLYDEDFFDYMDGYAEKVREKGARFFFAFSPTNAPAAAFTADEASALKSYVETRLGCRVLGSVAETTYGPEYFYNTNFHLNDAGAVLHTANLINSLKAELGIDTPTDLEIPVPGGSGVADDPPPEDDRFETEIRGGTLYLTGVKEEYRNATELKLPETIGGSPVGGLAEGFLAGCDSLTEVTVQESCQAIDVGAFSGCPKLEKIYLEIKSPGKVFIPDDGLLEGADGANLYIPLQYRGRFVSNYTWRNYSDRFVFY